MITTSAMHSPKAPVQERMADFLASHAAAAEGVTRDDLRRHFTEAQIVEHFEAAQEIALEKETRQ